MILTRDAILANVDTDRVEVKVPEWGGSVYVRRMNGLQREAFESIMTAQVEGDGEVQNRRASIVVACTVNEAGELLFSFGDIKSLVLQPWTALDRVANAAVLLNKLGDAEIDAEVKN